MTISITTNVPSLLAQNNLENTNQSLNRSISKLSSGSRIVSAQDDPAGLAISEKLKGNIVGTSTAKRNANDGISLLQVAEGAMTEIGSILIRMKELTIQAANETLSSTDRGFLDNEFQELEKEITRISLSTKFNGITLVSGAYSATGLILQVGLTAATSDQMTITLANVGPSALGSGTFISGVTIAQSAGQARNMIKFVEAAINDISEARSSIGSQLSRLNSTVRNLATSEVNLTQANSRVRDVDVASETANLTKNQILMQAGVSVLAQANSTTQFALSLI